MKKRFISLVLSLLIAFGSVPVYAETNDETISSIDTNTANSNLELQNKEVKDKPVIGESDTEKPNEQVEDKPVVGESDTVKPSEQVENKPVVGESDTEKPSDQVEDKPVVGESDTVKPSDQVEDKPVIGESDTQKPNEQVEDKPVIGESDTQKPNEQVEDKPVIGESNTEKPSDAKPKEYSISVTGGVADKLTAKAGETVTLTENEVEGKIFDEWKVTPDTVIIEENSFVMPESDVSVTAVFVELPPIMTMAAGDMGFYIIDKLDGYYKVYLTFEELMDGTLEIKSFEESPANIDYRRDVVIPSEINGATVSSIGANAFTSNDCIYISEFTIPESVTNIGANAFGSCESVKTINFKGSPTTIGENAFAGCTALTDINLEAFPSEWNKVSQNIGVDTTKTSVNFTYIDNSQNQNIIYKMSGQDGWTLTNGKQANKSVQVLRQIDKIDVTGIEGGAFSHSKITYLNVPNTVKSIGDSAFTECYDLTGLSLQPGLVSIGNGAFKNCYDLGSTSYISLPNSIKNIGSYAFEGCLRLERIDLPSGLETIGERAFANSGLKNVTIPSTVTSIGGGAFTLTKGNITVDSGNTIYTANEDYLIENGDKIVSSLKSKDIKIIPNEITEVSDYAFSNNSIDILFIKNADIVISKKAFDNIIIGASGNSINNIYFVGSQEQWNQKGLTMFADTSKIHCGIWLDSTSKYFYTLDQNNATIHKYIGTETEIVIPTTLDGHSVKIIGENAFDSCETITSVTIPQGVEAIRTNAFKDTYGIGTFLIPDSVQSIEENALLDMGFLGGERMICYSGTQEKWNSFKNLGYNSQFKIYTNCDYDKENRMIYERSGEEYKFLNLRDPVTSVIIERTFNNKPITAIANSAFKDQKITNIKFGSEDENFDIISDIAVIEDNAFQGCTVLNDIKLLDTLTTIGNNAFENCFNLKSIDFPNTLTSIGNNAFAGCASFTVLQIPKTTKIGSNAFKGCNNIKEIYFLGTEAEWQSKGGPDSIKELNPAPLVYFEAKQGEFTGFKFEDDYNNEGCLQLTEYKGKATDLTIPNSVNGKKVTSIGTGAFTYNNTIKSLKIPPNIKNIGERAFSGCSNLTNVQLSEGLKCIRTEAFKGTGLTSITIPNTVTIIYDNAFSECSNLKTITILREKGYNGSPFRNTNPNNVYFLSGKKEDIKLNLNDNFGPNTTIHYKPLTITFKIEGGTWADRKTEPIIYTFPRDNKNYDEVRNITPEQIPTGMIPNEGMYEYKWDVEPKTDHTNDVTYTYKKHIHTLEHFQYIAPTCKWSGYKEYHYCIDCCKYFEDKECTKEITEDIGTWKKIPATGHKYEKWSYNNEQHFHTCTVCGSKTDFADHKPKDTGTVLKEPTCTEKGEIEHTCSVCGAKYRVSTDPLGHLWGNWEDDITYKIISPKWIEIKRECKRCPFIETDTGELITLNETYEFDKPRPIEHATCQKKGIMGWDTYYHEWKGFAYGMSYVKTGEIPLAEHSWPRTTNKLIYTWSDDGLSCTVNSKCIWCDKELRETATITNKVTKQPTKTEWGETTYTATFSEKVYPNIKTKTIADVPPLSYKDWQEPTYEWNADKTVCIATQASADGKATRKDVATITNNIKKEVTCTENGLKQVVATFPKGWATQQISEDVVIPATGHSYTDVIYEWKTNNNQVECIAKRQCKNCNVFEEEKGKLELLRTKQEQTCFKEGKYLYKATFTNTWAETQEKQITLPTLEHKLITYQNNEAQHWQLCENPNCTYMTKRENHTFTEKVTTPPTCSNPGVKTYTCSVCGYQRTEELPKLIPEWNEPTYEWNAEKTVCTATRTCKNDTTYPNETASANKVTSKLIKAPTEATKGEITYTATFAEAWATTQVLTVECTDIGGNLTISGNKEFGNTLTANTSNLTFLNGDKPNLTYQWKADGVDISGANESAYTTTSSDIGKKITLIVGAGDKYNLIKSDEVIVTRKTPTITPPTATAIYGQTLESITLTNPQDNIKGVWTWENPTNKVGNVNDTNTHKATFTPTDTALYVELKSQDITVAVSKKEITIVAKDYKALPNNKPILNDKFYTFGVNASAEDIAAIKPHIQLSYSNGNAIENCDIIINIGNMDNYDITIKKGKLTFIESAPTQNEVKETIDTTQKEPTVAIDKSKISGNISDIQMVVYPSVDTRAEYILETELKSSSDDAKKFAELNTNAKYDISLVNKKDNKKITVNDKITVFLNYPSGSNSSTKFTVIHIKSDDSVEYLPVTNLPNGISFEVSSLSPFILGWNKVNAPKPTPPYSDDTTEQVERDERFVRAEEVEKLLKDAKNKEIVKVKADDSFIITYGIMRAMERSGARLFAEYNGKEYEVTQKALNTIPGKYVFVSMKTFAKYAKEYKDNSNITNKTPVTPIVPPVIEETDNKDNTEVEDTKTEEKEETKPSVPEKDKPQEKPKDEPKFENKETISAVTEDKPKKNNLGIAIAATIGIISSGGIVAAMFFFKKK